MKKVLITAEGIGRGDEELGRILMRNFLYSLARSATPPAEVFLVNEGVRLACAGSPVLADLELLVEEGVPVRACGTCLDVLHLTDSLAVGEVGKMPGLVEDVCGDDAVVTIG